MQLTCTRNKKLGIYILKKEKRKNLQSLCQWTFLSIKLRYQRLWTKRGIKYLLPEISISLMATAIEGSINKVVSALISRDEEAELMPKFERRTPTPASSRI
jgi:hypothetical protein